MFRVWIFLAIACLPILGAERLIQFSRMKAEEPPPGFRSALMGAGRPGAWKIIESEAPSAFAPVTTKAEAPKQNVLAQVSRDPTDNRYPLLILDGEEFGDFTLTTHFKLAAGVVEQMAGIAFRLQNESNYFYIRASGLFNTLRFVQVVNGEIINPVGNNMPIEKGIWHELKIQARGNQFDCWLDGKQAIPTATDNTYRAGKIAFWTKSDSVSYFADTQIIYTPRESLATIMVRDLKEKHPKLKSLRIVGKKFDGAVETLASARAEEVGQPASDVEKDVLANDKKYVGRNKELGLVIATLPLRDKNGDAIAAVRFEWDPFPGQTEKTTLERCMPLMQEMEARMAANKELNALQ